jgi:hypothetical protein
VNQSLSLKSPSLPPRSNYLSQRTHNSDRSMRFGTVSLRAPLALVCPINHELRPCAMPLADKCTLVAIAKPLNVMAASTEVSAIRLGHCCAGCAIPSLQEHAEGRSEHSFPPSLRYRNEWVLSVRHHARTRRQHHSGPHCPSAHPGSCLFVIKAADSQVGSIRMYCRDAQVRLSDPPGDLPVAKFVVSAAAAAAAAATVC